jgi:hypothetical protein
MIADPMLYRHLRFPDPLVQPCTFANGRIARAGGHPWTVTHSVTE